MKFRNQSLRSAAFATALFMVTGCSAMKNMDDMKNTTADVDQKSSDLDVKTSSLLEQTDDLDGKTTKLLDLTGLIQNAADNTFFGLRQGNAAEIREKMLKAMSDATTVESKIAYSTIYFEAFEYMLWTGKERDSKEFLQNQYLCAIQEFSREVTQYIPSDYKVDPTSQDPKMMNLYALSLTMHMTNELEIPQPALPQDDSTHTSAYDVSMFDLVKSSLAAEWKLKEGAIEDSDKTAWQKEGAAVQQLFIFLIQTRENFLSVMTLAKLSDIANGGFLGVPGLVRESKMLISGWDSKISALNLDQLNQYTSWLDESISDRGFLKSIGSDASLDGKVIKIYANMNKPVPADLSKNMTAGEIHAAHERGNASAGLSKDIQVLIKG